MGAVSGFSIDTTLDLLGVVVAFMSMIILFGIRGKLGTRIEGGLNFIMLGVFFNALALLWDIVFMYSPSLPQYLASMHHLFMIIGMIF